MPSARIRKQVYELTVEDLEAHGVWEYALDEEGEEGQDEATVRPYEPNGLVDPADGMFVVRAHLVLADGSRLSGYLTPPPPGDSSLGSIQPQAVAATGHVPFWCGVITPDPTTIAAAYARLGKSQASEVFPITFASDVPLVGGPIAGEVPGFVVLEDFRTNQTRVVL
jgi:hypothetical protein